MPLLSDHPLDTDRTDDADAQPLWKRLAWLAAIWTGSVLALGALAYGIRFWLKP